MQLVSNRFCICIWHKTVFLVLCAGGIAYLLLTTLFISEKEVMLWEAFSLRSPIIALYYVKKIVWNLAACGFALLISKELDLGAIKVSQKLGKETLGIYMLQTFVYENLVGVLSIPNHWPQWIRYCAVLVTASVLTTLCYYVVRLIRKNTILSIILLGSLNKKKVVYKE